MLLALRTAINCAAYLQRAPYGCSDMPSQRPYFRAFPWGPLPGIDVGGGIGVAAARDLFGDCLRRMQNPLGDAASVR